MSEPSLPPGALADIRVVEFAQALAVPYCGKILSDLGASVTKVEPPRGDTYRLQSRTDVKHEGREFVVANRGKRSLCLDFTTSEARTVIEALVADADVVLVSMKGSDLPRFGLDYETLRSYNEQIVYLQNSSYGSAGPLADEGGYDVVAMGLAGMSALLAAPDASGEAPIMVRPPLADMVTGMLAGLAVVTALRHRDRTGEGQRVETSLLHTSLGLISNLFYRFDAYDRGPMEAFGGALTAMRADGAGFAEQQQALKSAFAVEPLGNIYFRHYRTSDGFVSVGCLTPKLNQKLRDLLGLEDPRRVPGFSSGTHAGDDSLRRFMADAEAIMSGKTTDEWLDAMRGLGIPAAPMNFPHEIFEDPQALANGYIGRFDHPALGPHDAITTPIKLDATPVTSSGVSPSLGAHTDEILSELGLDATAIAELRAEGVVGRYDE